MSMELEKEETVQVLCAHYAQDHLSTGELESRFERVYRAADRAELRTVLEGLPALGPLVAPPTPLFALAPETSALPSGEKRYAAIFAEVKKEGHWLPARRIVVRAIFGTVLFDLREAALPSEGIELDVEAILGEVKVVLPPGVGADVDCSAILAEVSDRAQRALPGAPVIRVRGTAVLGTITVVTKLPKPARMESWRKQLRQLLGKDEAAGPR